MRERRDIQSRLFDIFNEKPSKFKLIMDSLKEIYTEDELADILTEKFKDVLEAKNMNLL